MTSNSSDTVLSAPDRGVVYVGIGVSHLEEALFSARSMAKHMPDLPILLFTDQDCSNPIFDRIVKVDLDSYDRSLHMRALMGSPFQQTVFLDTDTLACCPFPEIFRLLDQMDVAGVLSPKVLPVFRRDGAPSCFPQYNAGLLLVRRSEATSRFLDRWLGLYLEDMAVGMDLYPASSRCNRAFVHCQPSLRQALYESPVRIATLPQEYNYRFDHATRLNGEVKIIHGQPSKLKLFASQVNRYRGERFCYRKNDRIVVKPGAMQRALKGVLGLKKRGEAPSPHASRVGPTRS